MLINNVIWEHVVSRIDALANSGDVTGITTGFKELDKRTAGLQKSDLIIRKTKPGCGCTAITLGESTIAPGMSTTIRATFDSTVV